jgi:N-acetylated-alpha-linked acidic dipeptidase
VVPKPRYKHLGTAPGKNLGEPKSSQLLRVTTDFLSKGYGATTLPALTEALTIEKNSSLAQMEVTRLQVLISSMTKALSS